jgi:hypothetical protein
MKNCQSSSTRAGASRRSAYRRRVGKRLGILDNTKWNAGKLLRKTASLLGERFHFAAVNYYRKESFSKAADPALVVQIAADNDIVLTAIGD